MNEVMKIQKYDTSKSQDYLKSIADLLPGSTHTNFCDSDRWARIPIVRGKGSRVWDMDGNEHLDLFCSFGCMILGHNHEDYNEAIRSNLALYNGNATCGLEQEVCELLVKYIPCAEMVRFGLSGTESVQNAIRLARAYTGRNRFIRFSGHYHGSADNIAGGKFGDARYPIPERYAGDPLDTKGRADQVLENQSFVIPWNNFEILEQVVTTYANEIGLIIMEPVNMNGGAIMPDLEYLKMVRSLCIKRGILLLFDEVLTSIRIGLSGAQGYFNVCPDLAIFGKALSGGSFPITAIVGRKDIMSLFATKSVLHGGSYNGYPLGLAAIRETIRLLERPDSYQGMNSVLSKIAQSYEDIGKSEGIPLTVQGMPGALAFHVRNGPLQQYEDYRSEEKTMDYLITKTASSNGIQFGPISRLYGNIQMSDNDVDFFEKRIRSVIEIMKEDSVFRAMMRICKY